MSSEPDNRDAKPDGRHETPAEMSDRNFGELLQELRVAQTGVQFLFAFLLSMPFTEGFRRLHTGHKTLYTVALLATAIATACLLAPVSQHRMLFRRGRKRELVESGNQLAKVGLAFLLLAVLAAAGLVVWVVVSAWFAMVVALALLIVYVGLWYLVPMRQRD
jgi:O-antigen/teichoic acid export membrane protein